ncbi:DUF2207 domain-containing protein [Facklamia sp. DSM 111018]|uniref:DUF2207 domain-containing protein n=1 Tax=Facklamia lactis TaxID=2749967 RepID=A0ABS0LQZ6_9LACT|nr:DUF2207 domain-containing protein [Facklamia lactis]MBG9980762.1 DUF2207 domain-containing protein [Facklamia lactis]MBG9986576.1 DUF2207 domain-containing protein [Facklamia lactis]
MLKGKLVKLIFFLLFFLSIIVRPVDAVAAEEVEFSIDQQYIDVQVHEDGSVTFLDYQEYNVTFMNGAIFTLDHQGYNLLDFKVGITDQIGNPINFISEKSSSLEGGYYKLVDQKGIAEAKVYYPVREQSLYFVYEYTLEELVTNYNDTAELLRKFGSTDDTTDVKIRVEFPQKAKEKEELRAWGYGAPQGEVDLTNENGKSVVYFEVPARQSDQFVEGHIVFPKEWTKLNSNSVKEDRLQKIIDQSEAQVNKDRADVEKTRFLIIGALVLIALFAPLLSFANELYYRSQRKKWNPHPQYVPDYIYELPEKITPAQVTNRYFRSNANVDDFAATLLHLAQKKIIELESIQSKKKKQKTIQITKLVTKEALPKELEPHEKYVWEYFTLAGDQNKVTIEELDEYIEGNNQFHTRQNSHWTKFKSFLAVDREQYRGKTLPPNHKILFLLVFSSIVTVLSVVLSIIILNASFISRELSFGKWFSLILFGQILALVMNLILGLKWWRHPIMTKDQAYMHDMWQGFRKMLKDIGNFKAREIASLPLWEEYLVYATSLGVADKVVDALKVEFSEKELLAESRHYSGLNHPFLISHLIRSQVNQTVQSVAPQSSVSGGFKGNNQGGFGGGFSGGSMGGSGGGTHSGGF